MPVAPAVWESPDDILTAAAAWQDGGEGVALATVIATWGSSPRQPGSMLAVNSQGAFLGSVSGGCVEGAVIREAQDVIVDGRRRTLQFGVSNEDAWAVGLACGGTVRILVERLERA